MLVIVAVTMVMLVLMLGDYDDDCKVNMDAYFGQYGDADCYDVDDGVDSENADDDDDDSDVDDD